MVLLLEGERYMFNEVPFSDTYKILSVADSTMWGCCQVLEIVLFLVAVCSHPPSKYIFLCTLRFL